MEKACVSELSPLASTSGGCACVRFFCNTGDANASIATSASVWHTTSHSLSSREKYVVKILCDVPFDALI